jgi:hypothetical protein
MVAGVCCKLMNCIHFKDMLTLYFVYIPEMIFINSIFGYLVVLILVKWTTNWDATYILNNEEVLLPKPSALAPRPPPPSQPPMWFSRAIFLSTYIFMIALGPWCGNVIGVFFGGGMECGGQRRCADRDEVRMRGGA